MNVFTIPSLLMRLTPSVVWKIPSEEKVLYLTFDDGPHRAHTPELLRILRHRGAGASFFVTGQGAAALPHLVAEVAAEGNTIGNHAYTHTRLWLKSRFTIEKEMAAADAVLTEILAEPPAYFRPPYGIFTPSVVKTARRLQKTMLMWTINSHDYNARLDERTIITQVASRVKSGDIVLFHDGNPLGHRTTRCLDILIPALQDRGYAFATLPTPGDAGV